MSTYTASWPEHRVAISAESADPRAAEQILRSVHPVSVDRNGCAATRSPMAVTGSGAANPILPTGATSLSVCWYLGNRLGASALLDTAATSRVIDAVDAAPPKWPAPVARPALPGCDTVADHDGVLLTARFPDGSTAQAIGTFAACNGQQTVGNGTGAVLATKDLVSTIADAAGLGHALALDYPYTPS